MRWFRWNDGRQRSGYTVLPLFMSKRFDLYLLRYRKGDGIADHRDPVPGRRHFRLNWIVWNAAEGGEFKCTETISTNAGSPWFPVRASYSVASNHLCERLSPP